MGSVLFKDSQVEIEEKESNLEELESIFAGFVGRNQLCSGGDRRL